MIAGLDSGPDPFKVRLQRLHFLIAPAKVRLEGEIAHRDPLDLDAVAQRSLIGVEQMADESAFVGVTVKNENAQLGLPSLWASTRFYLRQVTGALPPSIFRRAPVVGAPASDSLSRLPIGQQHGGAHQGNQHKDISGKEGHGGKAFP